MLGRHGTIVSNIGFLAIAVSRRRCKYGVMSDHSTKLDIPTMRAVQQTTFGGLEVLEQVELPQPKPSPGQILIAVHAAGLNPTDWQHRATGIFVKSLPLVLGWDVSGVVEATGFGVTIFEPGDEVFGMLPYPHGVGAHAEYATGPARAFAPKPSGIGHVEAAALPLAALTAYQALVDTAHLQRGQRVLIHAAAGGVGHLAIQIAKARGAYVIGTASAAKHDFLRGLGIDEVIDYQRNDFTDAVDNVDVVLDPISGETRTRSLNVLRRGGVIVSLRPGTEGDVEKAAELGVREKTLLVEHDQAGMQAIAELVRDGKLRAHVEEVFALSEAANAHRRGETGRTTGKLVYATR